MRRPDPVPFGRAALVGFLVFVGISPNLDAARAAGAEVPAEVAAARPPASSVTLSRCDGSTPAATVAAHLEALRPESASAALPVLLALLPERAPLYRERDRPEVERLRAFLLATLARLGPPPEVAPFVLAELEGAKNAYSFAAAARAPGALGGRLGAQADAAVLSLLRALAPEFHDDLISLDRYSPEFPPEEVTTAALEAVRALARMGGAARPALPRLRELAEAERATPAGPGAVLGPAARQALAALGGAEPGVAGEPSATEWLPPERRPTLARLDVPVVDQDGVAGPLSKLADRPLALAYFYARCDNPNRCALTTTAMVRLQRAVQAAGLSERVRLLLATYEPQADTSELLKRFGADRGFIFGPGAKILRPDPARAAELLDELRAPVNFSAGWVNVHGLALYLIDGRGRYVRTYLTRIWDGDAVLRDLRALAAEMR